MQEVYVTLVLHILSSYLQVFFCVLLVFTEHFLCKYRYKFDFTVIKWREIYLVLPSLCQILALQLGLQKHRLQSFTELF